MLVICYHLVTWGPICCVVSLIDVAYPLEDAFGGHVASSLDIDPLLDGGIPLFGDLYLTLEEIWGLKWAS